MNKFHKFEIDINQTGRGTVKLDGENLNGVMGLEIKVNANELSIIKIEFCCKNIKFKNEILSNNIIAKGNDNKNE